MIAATTNPPRLRLSAMDSFFVAYQERSGVLMQLGGEADIEGQLTRNELEEMLASLLERWPQLGQRLRKNLLGVSWAGACTTDGMLRVADAGTEKDGAGRYGTADGGMVLPPDGASSGRAARGPSVGWRNQPINPFREPPFQALWIQRGNQGTLILRAHHSVMDGESFFVVGSEALRLLARRRATNGADLRRLAPVPNIRQLITRKQLRPHRLKSMWNYMRWLNAEAAAGRSTRLAMDQCATGDTHTCIRFLNREAFFDLKSLAAEARVSPATWCAAAWVRSIHAWNVSRMAGANPLTSLEIPVSLRRSKTNSSVVGNFISPLVVFADATEPLADVARHLKLQLSRAMRVQAHLSMPLLSWPAKFLPWCLFRRVAVSPGTTGFATSHFTWFEPESDVAAEVERLSGGTLRIVSQRLYTPVCLHMGAALAVVASEKGAQLFLTYRGNALSPAAANQLMDVLMSELNQHAVSKNFRTGTR